MKHISQKKLDKLTYQLAWEYLLSVPDVNRKLIKQHTDSSAGDVPRSLSDIYYFILRSAINKQMAPNVIGKSIKGVDKLGKVLKGFNPNYVVKHYDNDDRKLLKDIVRKLKPTGKVKRGKRSMWHLYCRTILSTAVFLQQFTSLKAFLKWVNFFDRDDKTRAALPMIIGYEVDGLGFALACDFLKEMGYLNFGKPDIHLKKIFYALGLCNHYDDYQVFKAICRIARNVNKPPYHVDKLFWLLGSGNFYRTGFKIGRHRDRFIKFAKRRVKTIGRV